MIIYSKRVDWDSVGGLESHIRSLKEMIVLPLLYPELFTRFGINPPRGVLFFGPPGTGKTLVARALANTCSRAGKKVFLKKKKFFIFWNIMLVVLIVKFHIKSVFCFLF